jgi:hypothetical protein
VDYPDRLGNPNRFANLGGVRAFTGLVASIEESAKPGITPSTRSRVVHSFSIRQRNYVADH